MSVYHFFLFQSSTVMHKYKTCFHEKWVEEEAFKDWLKKDEKDRNSVFCKVCCKSFNIRTGVTDSVRQQANGKRHKESSPLVTF